MSLTNFRVFTLPAWDLMFADHTYVTNDVGEKYPCGGRAAKGHQISMNIGDSNYADCLAKTDKSAGIRYGITGVCHQMANRILYPSNQLVSQAKGYRASKFVFGTYGRGKWDERLSCDPLFQGMIVSTGTLSTFDQRIRQLYAQINNEPIPDDLHAQELKIMINTFLGETFSEESVDRLVQLQESLHTQINEYVNQLELGDISAAEYVNTINGSINQVLYKCKEFLGERDFFRLFGVELDPDQFLIDTDEFIERNNQ